ncbi:MAG: hypothetical protein LUG66_00580 [Clostridiales bacterium]|nr:hypothetical protein [Clostridiales bacterium]
MNREEMLQKRIDELEKENRYLKGLLDDAGISHKKFDFGKSKEPYDENQGARIIYREITPEDANLFFGMFWGRIDVYSKRVVKKATGEVGYFPQCDNFWKSGCHRRNGSKVKCRDCEKLSYKRLERQ